MKSENDQEETTRERIQALEETIERMAREDAQLRQKFRVALDRIHELEAIVHGEPDGAGAYHELSPEQRIHQLRRYLLEQARRDERGRHTMDYREVLAFFDGEPSAGHTYNIMAEAAAAEGFRLLDDPRRIGVDAGSIEGSGPLKAEGGFSVSENTTRGEGV